jgi:lysozyme family protein
MAATTYLAFCARMIDMYEGKYGWNRKDPGGPTNFGITCFDLAEHRGQKMDSMERWAPIVKAMTKAEAEEIYRKKYAAALRYDDLPAGVDALLMDYGVNSGIGRPIVVMKRLLKVTGGSATRIDSALLDAIKKVDPVWLINQVCAERLTFMKAIKGGASWAEFGRGWSARVADLKAYSTHLATSAIPSVATTPAPAPIDLTKVVQPKATNVPATATKTTVGTSIGTGASLEAAGFPHWQVAAVVGGVFLVGILYEAYQDFKAKSANNHVALPAAA